MKEKKTAKAGATPLSTSRKKRSLDDIPSSGQTGPFDLVADETASPYDIISELYAYHDRLLDERSQTAQIADAPTRLTLTQSDQILLSEIEDMLRDSHLAPIARPVFRDALGWIAERALQGSNPNL